MSLSEPEDCIPQLRSGDLDLAIVFESAVVDTDDGIERVHLLEDPMYLALPRDHPLAHKRRLRLADLAAEAWVAGAADCECNRLISRACAMAGVPAADRLRDRRLHGDAGIRRRRRRRLADRRARPATVRDDIVVRDLGRDTPVRQIYAATLAEGYRAPATQAMVEILSEVAARYARGVPASRSSADRPSSRRLKAARRAADNQISMENRARPPTAGIRRRFRADGSHRLRRGARHRRRWACSRRSTP